LKTASWKEGKRRWRGFCGEELHDLQASPNISGKQNEMGKACKKLTAQAK
jgi:hypothetical protein